MQTFPPLENLGRRIVIMGPTNSGKSTLAVALGKKLDIPAVHLDQLRHLPHTNWEQRPDAEFAALHDEAIMTPAWVMDGGYSKLAPQRFERATAIVVVTDNLVTRYRRYFRRSLFQKVRAGALDGGQDGVRWEMVSWLWKTRNSARKYRDVARATGLPHVFVDGERELNRLYGAWNLEPVHRTANL